MNYRKAVELVLLKQDKVKAPFWFLAWNRELYSIDMSGGEIHIVFPSNFHNVDWDNVYETIPELKVETFLDLTRVSLPIDSDTITNKEADMQPNVVELKKILGIGQLDLSSNYIV